MHNLDRDYRTHLEIEVKVFCCFCRPLFDDEREKVGQT